MPSSIPGSAVPDTSSRARGRGLHLVVGGGLLLVYLGLAALGPWLVPYGPNDQDLLGVLSPASGGHWLGTDQIGRDLLSRLVVGGASRSRQPWCQWRWRRLSEQPWASSRATPADESTPRSWGVQTSC